MEWGGWAGEGREGMGNGEGSGWEDVGAGRG